MDIDLSTPSAANSNIEISRVSLFQRVPNLNGTRAQRLEAFNRIGSLLLGMVALFWCLFWVNYGSNLMALICFGFVVTALLLFTLVKFMNSELLFLLLVISVAFYIGASVIFAGGVGDNNGGSPHAFLLTTSTVVYFVLMGKSKVLQIGLAAFILLAFFVIELQLFQFQPILTLPIDVIETASYVNWFCAITSMSIFFGWLVKDANEVEKRLNISNSKFEELLEHIMPPTVIKRISDEGQTFAEGYKACSILFTDIVNFNELNSQYSAEELGALLNRMFADFDDATHAIGAEKIKTIGDSYMVATGLPAPSSDHAVKLLRLAFKLQDVAKNYPQVELRFGINSGPVTAGIIGKHKFVYDVWGDTVNVAARLDRLAQSGQILVSEQTYKLIHLHFHCERNDTLKAKGIGELNTYRVLGINKG